MTPSHSARPLQERPATAEMAAKIGNSYISETMTDSIEIPTAPWGLRCSLRRAKHLSKPPSNFGHDWTRVDDVVIDDLFGTTLAEL